MFIAVSPSAHCRKCAMCKNYSILELNYISTAIKLTCSAVTVCGFIAQLVEHRNSIAEVTGSNPVEALSFFRLLYSNCLN